MTADEPTDESPQESGDEERWKHFHNSNERIGATSIVNAKSVVDGYVSVGVVDDWMVRLRLKGDDGAAQVNGMVVLTPSRARQLAEQLEAVADQVDD